MKHDNNIRTPYTVDLNNTVIDAKNLFDDCESKAIVVLEGQTYKGLLYKDSLDMLSDIKNLTDLEPVLKYIYLTPNFSIFDWFKISSLYRLNSIPMVDPHDFSYLSSISYDDFAEKFKDSGLSVELSSIIILKKSTADFIYSEVFQIAEANAAKIFASYINFSNQEETEIVINLHHLGLNELLQSYRRYDFEVISFHDEDLHHETIKANSEYFTKYLTV